MATINNYGELREKQDKSSVRYPLKLNISPVVDQIKKKNYKL